MFHCFITCSRHQCLVWPMVVLVPIIKSMLWEYTYCQVQDYHNKYVLWWCAAQKKNSYLLWHTEYQVIQISLVFGYETNWLDQDSKIMLTPSYHLYGALRPMTMSCDPQDDGMTSVLTMVFKPQGHHVQCLCKLYLAGLHSTINYLWNIIKSIWISALSTAEIMDITSIITWIANPLFLLRWYQDVSQISDHLFARELSLCGVQTGQLAFCNSVDDIVILANRRTPMMRRHLQLSLH